MPVDPWGGWNQGFNQLMNVMAMKRQDQRADSTNALAMEKLKMEKEKFGMEKEQATRGKQTEMMKDAVVLTQDMTGDGSPEDMAKFQARRAMFVQKWGESPNIPKDYDPRYILGLKNYGKDPNKAYHSIGAGGLFKESTGEVIPPAARPAAELKGKEKIINDLLSSGRLTDQEKKMIAGAIKTDPALISIRQAEMPFKMSSTSHKQYLEYANSRQEQGLESLPEDQWYQQYYKPPQYNPLGATVEGDIVMTPNRYDLTPKIIPGPEGGLTSKNISEDYKKDTTALGQARDLVAELKSNWDALGIKSKTHGAMLYAQAYSGQHPEARMYLDSREAFLGNLSRSLAAERGVLTNQDIDRIKVILAKFGPNVITNDSPKDAQAKWDEIERILTKADARMAQRSKITQSNPTGTGITKTAKEPKPTLETSPAKAMPESEARERLKRQGIIGKKADEQIQKYKAAGVVE